ncbi:MAG: hypothetical protein DRI90_12305 [Deltaproteobacteria bacterium]|nr:MAG: hypothetical protein DRI90_12305 [Deltaproteobacteria bacterium]
MTPLWRSSAKALAALGLLVSFAALGLMGCPGAGIGDPCTPEDEYRENFAGFKLTEENIESRSFQCKSRICLVNHFQGRVSCPKGQGPRTQCNDDGDCSGDDTCTFAGAIVTDCDPTPCGDEGADPANCNGDGGRNPACKDRVCHQEGRYCQCESQIDCPEGYICEPEFNQCITSVCSTPGDTENRCYVPGTEIPITQPVCSQCAADSYRDGDNAVYCSCRCGVAEGEEEDDNFNFCECPDNFECKEIRKNVGLGDVQITGKYCIKLGTEFVDETRCNTVQGWWGPQCFGTATN